MFLLVFVIGEFVDGRNYAENGNAERLAREGAAVVADARAGDDAGIRELDGGADAPEALRRQRVDGNDKVGAHGLHRAAHELGINFIGGYSALVQKGFTNGSRTLISSIPQALAESAPKAAQPFRWRVAGT